MRTKNLKNAREIAESGLTLGEIGSARTAAYALMETRVMLGNARDMGARVPAGERGFGWAFAEIECRAGTIGGALADELRHKGIDPGCTADDATALWRELGEAHYLVRA